MLDAISAEVIGKALEKHPEFERAHWKDMFSFDLFATSFNHSGDEFRDLRDNNGYQDHELGERLLGLLVEARQEYEVEQTTINDEELDEASVDVADFIT